MSTRTFVIVGASLAGAKAAEALRELGFDGQLVLIGTEPERPYARPPPSAMNVNVWDVTDQIQALIRSRLRVDRDRPAHVRVCPPGSRIVVPRTPAPDS